MAYHSGDECIERWHCSVALGLGDDRESSEVSAVGLDPQKGLVSNYFQLVLVNLRYWLIDHVDGKAYRLHHRFVVHSAPAKRGGLVVIIGNAPS